VDCDLRWLEADGHHFIPWGSPDYPALLTQLRDPPIGLYVRGHPSVLASPQLAMVGSRNPTPAGRDTARDFAAHLASCGLTITSGLAAGIDTASHAGALAADGITIAVCGTGLDILYPQSNAALAQSIVVKGALISEFATGTPPIKHNFPRRNRLISGLALGTLVVEAAVRSGSLITARLAGEQGREVFAIPGSIHNPLARGCHQLIRQGAKLVETAQDILTELGPLASTLQQPLALSKSADVSGNFPSPLDKEYEILLDALGFAPAGMDLLVQRTGLKTDVVASMLLILELDGHIESYPGGLYVRTRP
jgi:DNA processing protein